MYKKVLALDCDGTLWDGVVGEDGPEHVRPFVDFQKALIKVADEGVLLVLLSKNNEQDVWDVFEKNKDMVLPRDYIVGYRINWEEKAENVAELAQELNLGLDSFVFWDDNPIELEKMRQRTAVIVPNIPDNIADWPEYVQEEFYCDEITVEDKKRMEYYRTNAKFVHAKADAQSEEAFLQSIGMQATTHTLDTEDHVVRAAQLCNKTNQFNLRTIRHEQKDIESMMSNENNVVLMTHLKDTYGEYGDIGLVIATKQTEADAFLDTFLMSCRVMQRHVESYMLLQCCYELQEKGYSTLHAEYRPTERNGMTANFFDKHGLSLVSEAEGVKQYVGDMEVIIAATQYTQDLFISG